MYKQFFFVVFFFKLAVSGSVSSILFVDFTIDQSYMLELPGRNDKVVNYH